MKTSKTVNFLICEYCGWKKVSRKLSELEIHKVEDDKFKCKNCGRMIKLKFVEDVQKNLDLENKNIQRKKEFEQWTKENLQE